MTDDAMTDDAMTDRGGLAMHVTVDLGVCNGYGHCLIEAPGHFDLDEETGKATLISQDVAESDRAAVESAVTLCPVGAIKLTA
jgi:ferredoxin